MYIYIYLNRRIVHILCTCSYELILWQDMQLISTGLVCSCICYNPTITTSIGYLDGMSSILNLFHGVFFGSPVLLYWHGRLEDWKSDKSWQIDDISRLITSHPTSSQWQLSFVSFLFIFTLPCKHDSVVILLKFVLEVVLHKNSSHLPKHIRRYPRGQSNRI